MANKRHEKTQKEERIEKRTDSHDRREYVGCCSSFRSSLSCLFVLFCGYFWVIFFTCSATRELVTRARSRKPSALGCLGMAASRSGKAAISSRPKTQSPRPAASMNDSTL